MRCRRYFILILCLGLFFFQPCAMAEDDWQYWNLIQLKGKVAEEWSWRIFTEQWLSEDFSHFFLTNVDTGLTWQPQPLWSLGAFYRYQYVDPAEGDSVAEHRYYPEITFYAPLDRVKISNRVRFEYHETNKTDFWWLRDRLYLSVPVDVKGRQFSPFVTEELFYHTGTGSINESRLGGGVSFKVAKRVELSLYYQVRHFRKRSDWTSAQVLGTTWTISV